jgi:hypothetical protein
MGCRDSARGESPGSTSGIPTSLPLLGVTVSERRFAMVSEWMENGDINEFVAKDKHVNRTELVRRPSIPTPTKPD